jgi:ribosome-binding protein aMBF1 (putative translation factor)
MIKPNKNNQPVTLDELFESEMQDPSFKKEWEDNAAEYELSRAMIQSRIKSRLSQRDLAKKVGTTQAVLSRIESNVTSPTFRMASRIARGLGKRLQVRFV